MRLDDEDLRKRMFEIASNPRYMEAIREILIRGDADALGTLKTSRDPAHHAEAIQLLQHNDRFLSYFTAAQELNNG